MSFIWDSRDQCLTRRRRRTWPAAPPAANGDAEMHRNEQGTRGFNRRTALKLAAGTGLAASTAWVPRQAHAAEVTLSAWTGYPELVPWYQTAGEAYAKLNPGFKLNVLS